MTTKKKKFDLAFKLTVVKFAEQNSGEAAARHFSVHPRSVLKWRKIKTKLECLSEEDCKRARLRGAGRKKASEELEVILSEWIHSMHAKHLRLSHKMIRTKAKELYATVSDCMDGESFAASAGWLDRFLKRHDLSVRGRTTVDQKDTRHSTKKLGPIVELPGKPADKMGDTLSDRQTASLHVGQNEPSEPEWTTRQQTESTSGSRPTTMTTKRKKYDLAFKLTVVKFAEQNSGEAAARHFSVDPTRVKKWRKIKTELERVSEEDRKRARLRGGGRKKGPIVELPGKPADKMADSLSDRRTTSLHVGGNDPSEPEWTTRQQTESTSGSRPTTMMTKRKKYDLAFKLTVVKFAEQNSGEAAGRHFSVHPTKVNKWRKIKTELERLSEEDCKRARLRGGGRKKASEELEVILSEWIHSMHAKHLRVTHKMIRTKAKELYATVSDCMDGESFAASAGWLHRFLKRHAPSVRGRTTVDQKDARHSTKKLGPIVELPGKPADKMADSLSDRQTVSLHVGQNEPSEPEWTTRQQTESTSGSRSTTMMTKRKKYDLAFKLTVVKFAEQNSGEAAARHFSVDPKRVREWRKIKTELERLSEEDYKRARLRGGGRKKASEELELAVSEWIHSMHAKHLRLSHKMIRTKAKELYATGSGCMDGESFAASAGWLDRFLKRHDLSVRGRTTVDQKNTRHSTKKLQNEPSEPEATPTPLEDCKPADKRPMMECNITEMQQIDQLSMMVKQGDIKEEEYGHMISCPDEEEKPFAELHWDFAESSVTCNETQQTTAEIEVKIEDDDEQEHDYLLGSESEHPQQKIHGQNDKLQLKGRLRYCTVCGKSFTALRELKKHQQTHTVGVNPRQSTRKKQHECVHCGKVFSQVSHLKTHMLVHTGEKPYKCVHCGKGFSLMGHLKTHILIHTGEKSHKCIHCGKAFSQLPNLKTHMRTHTGEMPHKCVQCGKAFPYLSALKVHSLIHTGERPHKCIQCGKAFIIASHLKSHMMTHSGEKPHICGQCGKAFSQIPNLKTHMQTHTGKKPYNCSQCGKGFTRISYLTAHMLIHTGE
ncbi:uncharacterized protein LOC143120928 isoform X1 [Alosa pseudoharengus]|uniref:uncharacterized protein LOC143120928 isoform X1 n=1 Tax=Alosa pseudoharengus TaxID=34774 RepID=UPI003F8B0700